MKDLNSFKQRNVNKINGYIFWKKKKPMKLSIFYAFCDNNSDYVIVRILIGSLGICFIFKKTTSFLPVTHIYGPSKSNDYSKTIKVLYVFVLQ